ncbi:MAG: hypothetical protein WKF33_10225 [Thermoleophilaceae bacterium]
MSQAPYLIGEMEREGAWRVQRIVIREHPDPSWALLVSEVVHHLRAALDYLVWQLVLLNGAEPYHRYQFPIYAKRAPAHTNTVERVSSLFTRGILGSYLPANLA